MAEEFKDLTSGRVLARSTVFNWLGLAAPLVLGLFAVPLLISALGLERFGILSLFWALVGYFSLFDLGIGRALTVVVAQRLSARERKEIPGTIWSALALVGVLGVVGGVVLAVISPWIINAVFEIPTELKNEALNSAFLLSASLPLVVAAAGLRGALEAVQRFGLIALVRVVFAAVVLWGPLAIAPYSISLVWMVGVLVAGRLVVFGVFLWGVCETFPRFLSEFAVNLNRIEALVRLGAWMTVSNTISPILVNLDRFVIGSVVSMSAVAYYTTPFEVLSKLLIIPAAVSGVLFSALSAMSSADSDRSARVYNVSFRFVIFTLSAVVLFFVLFVQEMLEFWITKDFAAESYRVARAISLGILFNGLAHVPFSAIQAARRPDLTGKLHIIEVLPFVLVLLSLTNMYGIEGAAWAWTARAAADLIVLSFMVSRLQGFWLRLRGIETVAIAVLGIAICLGLFPLPLSYRIWLFVVAVIPISVLFGPFARALRRFATHK